MRQPRLRVPSSEKEGFYHCVSRVVGRAYVLGDTEKEKFQEIMRRQERLCHLQVLTYCVMSDHFHLLVRVPKRPDAPPSDAELIKHLIRCEVHPVTVEGVKSRLGAAAGPGTARAAEAARRMWFARMWDLGFFMKGLKQEFTQWFNREHGRGGTLWEARFKSVLVEGTPEALQLMAAYIDMNPVRAGLVADPKDYPWCGYGEAAGGGRLAAQGIALAVCGARSGAPAGRAARDAVLERYRRFLFGGDEERGALRPLRRGRVQDVLKKRGKLSVAEMLRCRVRYFSDGAVLGSAEFVNGVFRRERARFGPKRKDGARKMARADVGGLRVLRNLRLRVYEASAPGG